MKNIVIALITLSCVSIFANCTDGTVECYLGTYEGVRELGVHAFVSSQKCRIEITQNPYDYNDINFNYKYIQKDTRKRTSTINGKVSSNSQKLISYSRNITEFRHNGIEVRDHYIYRIELERELSKDSKRNRNYLQLKLDDNLELAGVSVKEMKFNKTSKLISLALFSGWMAKGDSCTNLVKVD